MEKKLTTTTLRRMLRDMVREAKDEFNAESNRDDVMEWIDQWVDDTWGDIVFQGMLTDYDLDDLMRSIPSCAVILELAKSDAWIEDDSGLWDGLTYGVVPSVAYFSLRNLAHAYLSKSGHDTNEDHPFA